ncbi:uncharacterized protein BDW43DRAFT_258017 [Aspergillus alliaceus]|uniref:uncharacterized protein n=1 Tax=Petromyces alliaceus TaxID=209559 RepID=UPI0012A5AC6C|nr:uncharacterized protein BDW43DRAFT_258017 [Aspergillus alliaceus]KAB8239425.1 hypothetical protein BDW43DRAFT_258017 [Aspergillus alliaceus]
MYYSRPSSSQDQHLRNTGSARQIIRQERTASTSLFFVAFALFSHTRACANPTAREKGNARWWTCIAACLALVHLKLCIY